MVFDKWVAPGQGIKAQKVTELVVTMGHKGWKTGHKGWKEYNKSQPEELTDSPTEGSEKELESDGRDTN